MCDFEKILEYGISTDIITYQNDKDSKLHELKKSKAIQMKSSTIFVASAFVFIRFYCNSAHEISNFLLCYYYCFDWISISFLSTH